MNGEFFGWSARLEQRQSRRQSGFTLIELVMVFVLLGVLAAAFMVFFRPMLNGYFSAQRRADLSDIADSALRRMGQELRTAVPNSINLVSNQCFQFAPSTGGGRYRREPISGEADVACGANPGATHSAWPNPACAAGAVTWIDFLALQSDSNPQAGDFVVINNVTPANYYGASPTSRYVIQGAGLTLPRVQDGVGRVQLNRNPAALGYYDGRFQTVAAAQPSVMYSCTGGKLLRTVMTTNAAIACQSAGDVLASGVLACDFTYAANPSATEASAYVSLLLSLQGDGETVTLSYGVHLDNSP